MNLGTIDEEAAACRAAWAACPGATHGAHIHHESACEALTEPIERRIAYIIEEKPEHERAIRLRLMRPTTAKAFDEYARVTNAAKAEYLRVVDTAWAEHQSVVDTARAEYLRVTDTALDEYRSVVDTARAEYLRITDTALDEYRSVVEPAWAEYLRVKATAHRPVCHVEGCPFDGATIFPGAKS